MTVDTKIRVYPEVAVDWPTCRNCGRQLHTLQEIENELCKACQINQAWAELEQELDTDDDYHAWLDAEARHEAETIDSLRFGLHG